MKQITAIVKPFKLEEVREGLAERWKGYRGNWCLG